MDASTTGPGNNACSIKTLDGGTKLLTCSDGTSTPLPGVEVASNVGVKNFHGMDYLMSTGDYANGAKILVNATITRVTATLAGVVTVSFSLKDGAGNPYGQLNAISAAIAKLLPATDGRATTEWVSYINRSRTTGTFTVIQGTRENNGKLTNLGDGTYTYVFATDLTKALNGATPIAYDRNLTHRVTIMMGGHSGATADAFFDFVPDGTPVVTTRNIVETATCKNCHGNEFHGHGGDRLTVENCVVCHNPSSPSSYGPTADMTQMIHKIHAGAELPSIAGADGIVWDNPATAIDESADNGTYAFGSATWWKSEFPAMLGNCQSCHQGAGAQVDNWKTVASRAACGSCHDNIDFATGTNHGGGPATTDAACAACHTPTKNEAQHDWTTKDERNIPEFTLDLSVSSPTNGTHFVTNESPVVTLVIKKDGLPIDHTTVTEDTEAEGCAATVCPSADGKFFNTNLFVHGPRSARKPALTTAARAVVAGTSGPFDLSAPGASLAMVIDGGTKVIRRDSEGGDLSYAGNITVAVPTTGTAFANKAAATAEEVILWLNNQAAFKGRAIAYLQNGNVMVRSRNLGLTYSVQLLAGPVTTAVFAGDTTVHSINLSTASNKLAKRVLAANDDPKATRTTEKITYLLDPVDDLEPGTYIASVEMADRGRVDAVNYKTPSVAKVAFQVKTPYADKQIADGCESCHQGPDGRGLVLDPARHNKILDHNAIDQCGACHDYQSQNLNGQWAGAQPISKRIHAIHNGTNLSYPQDTVGYVDPVAGRHWDITFPQNILNCQSCHSDKDTSGTWATKPNRLACWGCHDSDAAQAHIRLNTYDPTPLNPWSGDEQEACITCHASVTR
jgi:predicted CXXCH cytochrome family protein